MESWLELVLPLAVVSGELFNLSQVLRLEETYPTPVTRGLREVFRVKSLAQGFVLPSLPRPLPSVCKAGSGKVELERSTKSLHFH